jgi:CubicO group peptidase (beta-lactamase class C family)/lysophospholipase L1-like esterase
MKKTIILLGALLLLPFLVSAQIRVVCVGDSITAGWGLTNAQNEAYPARLQELLGPDFKVLNCGVSGSCMVKKDRASYWDTSRFIEAENFDPQIVIIKLGTNDGDPPRWNAHKNEFYNDYLAMINAFRKNGRNPRIFVCYPVPCFGSVKAPQDRTIKNEVIPLITKVADSQNLSIIDFNTAMQPYGSLFPDNIHPNAEGAEKMAEVAFNAIKNSDLNFNKDTNALPRSSYISSNKAEIILPLPRSSPEAQGVPSPAIFNFVESLDRIDTMHSFMILRHGNVIAEGWWKPESAGDPHILNSVSKSFNSTAVGLAIEEGKLNLNDRVLKFFPEDAPPNPSENLKAMTVRDLLTMTGGQDTEPKAIGGDPSVKQFLAHPFVYKPGTHFLYNTMGAYVLSAIVTKVTGQTTLEYLKPRLFEPLGIENPKWLTSPEGNSLGGYGLYLRTEDIAKFGQLYLQNGRWNGKQLIPKKWIKQATSKQVPNDQESHSQIGIDWQQGYGYQFWRCTHNAYRGDGAGGQFCVVIPKEDMVIAMTAGKADMQAELNAIWNNLYPVGKAVVLSEDDAATEKLKQLVDGLQVHPSPK